jgi:hypothetical protein
LRSNTSKPASLSSPRSRPFGASRPVELDLEGKAVVIEAIDVIRNKRELDDAGLLELRNVLLDDLHEEGAGP